jgi:hypothetical protein
MPPIFSFLKRKSKCRWRKRTKLDLEDAFETQEVLQTALAKYRRVLLVSEGMNKAVLYTKGLSWERKFEMVVKNALRGK